MIGDIPANLLHLTVADVLHNGAWDLTSLSHLLPAEILEED